MSNAGGGAWRRYYTTIWNFSFNHNELKNIAGVDINGEPVIFDDDGASLLRDLNLLDYRKYGSAFDPELEDI
jgi:hypothetical protein